MTRSLFFLLVALLLLPACEQSFGPTVDITDDAVASDDDDATDDGALGDDDDSVGDDDDSTDAQADDDDATDPPTSDDDDATGDDDDSVTPPEPPGSCTSLGVLACGAVLQSTTLDADATNEVDAYACSTWNESGPEKAWTFTAQETGPVTAALTEIQSGQDLDVFVLDGTSCSGDDCVAYGNVDATFDAVAGATYTVVVDGYNGAAGTFTLELLCGEPAPPLGDDDDATGDDDDATGDDDDSVGQTGDDDDATGDDDDGVDVTPPGICAPDAVLTGPSVDSWENDGAGSTDAIDTWSCVGWDESGPEYVYEYVATVDGQATANVQELADEVIELVLGPLDDLDIFVLDPSNGCSASSCVAHGDATVSWAVTAGSTWYIAIDGANGDVSPYDLTITEVGTTPPPPPSTESACTDGLDDDADGLVDCDDPDCGAANACQVGTCIPARVLSCGGTDSWNNGATGSWQLIDTYGCTSWNESGPEVTYLFTPTSAVDVTVELSGMSADLDLFVSAETGSGCEGAGCLAFGNTSASFEATAGTDYYVTVDGFNGAVSDFDLTVTCQ